MTADALPHPVSAPGRASSSPASRLRLADAAPGAELTLTLDHAARLLRVIGEVDLSTAGLLRHFLEQEASSGRSVTLDLSGVSFMDSSGMAALLHGVACMDGSAQLIVLHPSGQVRRLLEISGVEARPGLRILD